MLESAPVVQANQQVIDDLLSNKPTDNSQIYSALTSLLWSKLKLPKFNADKFKP